MLCFGTWEMSSSVSSLTSVLCVLYTSATVSDSVALGASLVPCVLGDVVWTASHGRSGVTWCPAGGGLPGVPGLHCLCQRLRDLPAAEQLDEKCCVCSK